MRMLRWFHVFFILAALCGGAVWAAPADKPAKEEVEEVEEVEVAQVQPAAPAKPAELGLTGLIGRMHPALVHLPIGFLLLVLMLEFGGLAMRRPACQTCGLFALILTVASFVPGLLSGFLRADELASAGQSEGLVSTHRNLIITVAGITLVALVVRLTRRKQFTGVWRGAYLVLLIAAAGLVGYAGHLGGQMVYGADYLPF